jgi:hypothetical protein
VRLLQGVADAGMAGGEDALARPLKTRRVELEIHQLVHVLADQHVAVELHDAVVLDQAEGRQLGPAVVEARVGRVVLAVLWQEVFGALLGDTAGFERRVALGGEGVGVECYEGVFRAVLLEAVVQREEAREVLGIGDEGRPDCCEVSERRCRVCIHWTYLCATLLPFESEPS